MRRIVWGIRIGFLLVAGVLLVGAIQIRRDYEADQDAARDVTHTEAGITGQHQDISFEIHREDGRPLSFATELDLHCSNTMDWGHDWTPGDGRPVPFHWNGQRLRVREPAASDYDSGAHGSGVATMRARRRGGGLEGSMRSVWRFEREDGQEYAVCDSGFVPFAVGAGARRRVRSRGAGTDQARVTG